MRHLARLLKALADETRLQIFALLIHEGELCVCDFVQVLQTTQSKASRHLRYLYNAGLIADRREAVWVHYRIPENLDPFRAELVQLVGSMVSPLDLDPLVTRLKAWQEEKKLGKGCSPTSDQRSPA